MLRAEETHLFEQETDCILQRAAQASKLLCIPLHRRLVYGRHPTQFFRMNKNAWNSWIKCNGTRFLFAANLGSNPCFFLIKLVTSWWDVSFRLFVKEKWKKVKQRERWIFTEVYRLVVEPCMRSAAPFLSFKSPFRAEWNTMCQYETTTTHLHKNTFSVIDYRFLIPPNPKTWWTHTGA